jgi:uncharacterized protein with NRDE domain
VRSLPPDRWVIADHGRDVRLTIVCLLVLAWKVDPLFPLVVGANRDERFDRPTHSFTVLRDSNPRILGGRDELAGGTWLAVNEHGVVAGLTNTPSPGGPDPSRRSRGELPLLLAGQTTAARGVERLVQRVKSDEYNPAWMLVGDRESLFYLELATGEALRVRELTAGTYILENVPLDASSPKIDYVRSLVRTAASDSVPLWTVLPSILSSHVVADFSTAEISSCATAPRVRKTLAPCVHTEHHGTRSASLIRVPSRVDRRPEVLVADGPPCTTPFVDVSSRWLD